MNLSLADLRDLPLAAALIASSGDVIVHTPEWQGGGPGSAAYPVRRNRLVVCCEPAAPRCTELLQLLLAELHATATELGGAQRDLVRMLASSLELVAGRAFEGDVMPARRVLDLARCGIAARTGLQVTVEARDAFEVAGGYAAALVLVQLAANAERHARAETVTLAAHANGLHVSWPGDIGAGAPPTARRHDDRERWGLGFARIAADAIGGVVHAPQRRNPGAVTATLELGVGRLTLPLAMVREGRVARATRAWDEETGALPGTSLAALPRAEHALADAQATPGRIARIDGLSARAVRDAVWLAVPPDDVAGRARDVTDGLTHERVLTEGIGEPRRSRINALAQLLGFVLGAPIQRVPSGAWVRRMRGLAAPFGLAMPVPDFDGVGATDPAVCALLAAEAGVAFEVEDDSLWLRLHPQRLADAVAAPLLGGGADRIRLG